MRPYYIYMAILLLFNILILATPLITISNPPAGLALHGIFSLTCHQIVSRSYCYYPSDGTVGDCPDIFSTEAVIETEKGAAYKFPVCARDLPLYLAAMVSGAAVYFTKWRDSRKPPSPLFFMLALIPIALDGGSQFIGLRESTNELRAITGIIAGFAFSFYFVPMLNAFLMHDK
jgi:uncharacterized membrane protein